ncbi:hypothetical protein N7493_001973 [Penicillium malachiteum]|uniref:Uncharacterized protein n=1 Tax=Penicillium malachiteum TaxID=1324776 RepID=A0AAD6HVY6_9EURO|nr:hypothetical protein N7493_001973 [Penicillium malachiteum]
MSPTLTTLVIRAHKALTIGMFGLWIAGALGFIKIDLIMMDEGQWEFFDLCLSTSLLTWLVCRFSVTVRKNTWSGSLVYRLSCAHHRQSRRDALVLFFFACGWTYQVILRLILLGWLTLLGGAIYVFHIYSDAIEDLGPEKLAEMDFDLDTTLKQIDKFKGWMGFDPVEVVGWISPRFMVLFLVISWISVTTLSFYVVRVCWKSLKVIFRLPSEEPESAAPKLYVA